MVYHRVMVSPTDIEKKFSTYTVGALVKFMGEDWFDDIKGQIGFVSHHDRSNDAIEVVVGGKVISIYVDEFSCEEISVYQKV